MFTCFLCLENQSHQAADKSIKIDCTESNVAVADLISKYFGIALKRSEVKLKRICQQCWKIIINFHNLYEFVLDTQKALNENKNSQVESDPLPLVQEVFSDSEKAMHSTVDIAPNNIFFCPEIKIEERDLDQLPKIEIIESTHAVEVESCLDSSSQIDQFGSHHIETPTNISIASNGDAEAPIRRRGRSPINKNSVDERSNLKNKNDIREEESYNFSDDISEDNQKWASDDDNSTNSGSDSFDCESDIQEKYAVVPKRVAVRPKKYKKRAKPVIAPVRMARDEIERRKAQQEEYDKILQKFFNNKFACAICNLLVQNFTDMVRHHRITHKIDQGYMTCCGRKFKQRKTLAEHALVHWNPDHFKCSICNKVFQNSRLLENHEQTHSSSGELRDKTIFQCDKCPKTFASKSTFDYHNLSKHVPKSELKFICPQCNKRLLTERKLKNHIKSAHDPENAIICDKCGKQMRTKQSLKKHQELMHSDVPRPEPVLMQCQICGTWLKDLRGLKQHMKSIHIESVGEHRCHVCNKVSPNARALRRHIYHNHECERKFKCTMCEKAFKRPQELREHTSTHTGEVLYTCPNCPMTFFCSANMYKHRQRLHRAQYEADKNQPRPPNILQQAVGATAAMKIKLMQGSE